VNHPEKTLMGKFAQSQGRLSESSPPRSDGSQDSQNRGAGPRERWPKVVKTKLAQWGIRLESTKIRWFSWWPGGKLGFVNDGQRRSQGELENNSRKPGDLNKNGIVTA
jgi:hypothetical protein